MDPLEHILSQLKDQPMSDALGDIEASTLKNLMERLQTEITAAIQRLSRIDKSLSSRQQYSREHIANLELHHEKTRAEILRKRRVLQELHDRHGQMGSIH
jgi:hypothetical protein